MTTNNHPAHGPVSLDRLHQISEILSKAAAQSDGGNLGYAMADAVKVIDGVISIPATLPCPVHLEPGLKFGKGVRTQCLLDALRRRTDYYAELEAMTPEQRAEHDAGIEAIKAMLPKPAQPDIEMLASVLRNAPLAPSDSQGKPRAPVVPDEVMPGGLVYSSALPQFESNDSDKVVGYYCVISGETRSVESMEQAYADAKAVVNACRAAMLKAGNSPVTPDGWIPVSERMPENKPGSYEYIVFESLNNRAHHDYWNVPDSSCDDFAPFWNHYGKYVTHWMPLPTAPKQEVK